MSTDALPVARRWNWRRITFTILASLGALLFLINLYRLPAPWAPLSWLPNDDPRQLNLDLHRWHTAMWGAVSGILEGGAMLTLLWRPRENPLLMQFMASVAIVGAPIMLPFEPGLLIVFVVLVLIVILYPFPRALLDFSREGSLSRPLLGLSIGAALLLVPYMVRLEIWQIKGVGGEHAVANQWVSDVEHAAFLLLALFLARTRRPGWQILSLLTGVVFLYLGVAALALPNHPGSWGTLGGIMALIGGLLYIIVTIREARKAAHDAPNVLSSVAS